MKKDVIVVRANENLDKKVIDQMLAQGFAPGFKASASRVSGEIQYIIITNTDNDRAVLANVTKVSAHVATQQTEQNLTGRIDIYFSDPKAISPEDLYSNVDFNNSNPVRYIEKYWI
ncbi:hypothetical protein [Desulfogranum marinum]|uniref:hypothetical protein n=1 Tax=Desulfogranum marinum TaxID=453220 RepID=UPI0019660697|nr:hypothetical protein [Desulfogranum marinum]MBM9513908.1 hypothetical protein [Desulfogranum marinum]